MPLIFSEIESAQIDGLWNKYLSGLQECKKRWPKEVEWTPDDVKGAIKSGIAQMVNVYQKDKPVGFMVLRGFREEFSKRKYLHIWIGYLYQENRGKIKEFMPDVFDYLGNIAKKAGAYYIEMDTPRKGWERIMKTYDMRPKRVVYRRGV